MSGMFDKLNLRPQERRLVVVVGIVVFVVINVWFVFPKFGALGKAQQRIRDERATLANFQREVEKRPLYQGQRDDLAKQGEFIAQERQATAFSQEVLNQAGLAGVKLPSVAPGSPGMYLGTNAFFEEQTLTIGVRNAGERELVTFLYNLGKGNSLTRVFSMTLRPDPSRMSLDASMTLVKSFQRKQSAQAVPSSRPPEGALPASPTAAPPAAAAPIPAGSAPAPRPGTPEASGSTPPASNTSQRQPPATRVAE